MKVSDFLGYDTVFILLSIVLLIGYCFSYFFYFIWHRENIWVILLKSALTVMILSLSLTGMWINMDDEKKKLGKISLWKKVIFVLASIAAILAIIFVIFDLPAIAYRGWITYHIMGMLAMVVFLLIYILIHGFTMSIENDDELKEEEEKKSELEAEERERERKFGAETSV